MKKQRVRGFATTIENFIHDGMTPAEARQTVNNYIGDFSNNLNAQQTRLDEMANNVGNSLTVQLITLATLLITVTGIFIAQQDIFKVLSDNQRVLILATLISLLISIGFGIADYFKSLAFFETWSSKLANSMEVINQKIKDAEFKSINDLYNCHRKNVKNLVNQGSKEALYKQLGFLIFGSMCFIAVLITVMFDFNGVFHNAIFKG